jgi:hypothetical protein
VGPLPDKRVEFCHYNNLLSEYLRAESGAIGKEGLQRFDCAKGMERTGY